MFMVSCKEWEILILFFMNHSAPSPDTSFWKLVRYEFYSTIILYKNIISNPFILLQWTYHVLRDIFYELPKSFFVKTDKKNLETHLENSASQCITMSEVVTIPWNYIWFLILQLAGFGDFFSSIIGANVWDYFSSVISYTLLYILLTRGHGHFYTIKNAFYDCFEVIKDCLPAALVLYITEAPFIALLLFIWLSPALAIALNLVLAMTVYIGVAKYSTTKNIEKRFE